ncbi:hypothetical protein B0A52_02606 [Exophiala mesophila]|uniref:Uncharacterized protein n=1 Tax=Exophiala mesophila TaxID=212818 RepID=A0A438NDG3_EXOME|nr:hypothetical protein B0A52_02606 [Exophiala mesophila]
MTKTAKFSVSEIPRLDGYVIIVTGGNSGIGFETTTQLARRGARVYIAARSESRVQSAIKKLEAGPDKVDVRFLKLDLQDLQSIKTTVSDFLQKENRLDILLNNAGIMATPYELTKDGYEAQWQTCFLGHHALTLGLIPLLKSTAAQNPSIKDRVRIINVSSDMAFSLGPKTINYSDPNMKRYSHCKQASIIAAKALNDRYQSQGITAYSLHPGVIKTNLQTAGASASWVGALTKFGMMITPSMSVHDGALTSLFCATSPQAAKNPGWFYSPIAKLDHRADKWLNDPEAMRKLWDLANTQLKSKGFELN